MHIRKLTAILKTSYYRNRKKRRAFFQSLPSIEGSEAGDVHCNYSYPVILLENRRRRVLIFHYPPSR